MLALEANLQCFITSQNWECIWRWNLALPQPLLLFDKSTNRLEPDPINASKHVRRAFISRPPHAQIGQSPFGSHLILPAAQPQPSLCSPSARNHIKTIPQISGSVSWTITILHIVSIAAPRFRQSKISKHVGTSYEAAIRRRGQRSLAAFHHVILHADLFFNNRCRCGLEKRKPWGPKRARYSAASSNRSPKRWHARSQGHP